MCVYAHKRGLNLFQVIKYMTMVPPRGFGIQPQASPPVLIPDTTRTDPAEPDTTGEPGADTPRCSEHGIFQQDSPGQTRPDALSTASLELAPPLLVAQIRREFSVDVQGASLQRVEGPPLSFCVLMPISLCTLAFLLSSRPFIIRMNTGGRIY